MSSSAVRCAALLAAASCVLSEMVELPFVNVLPGVPKTFEIHIPAGRSLMGAMQLTNVAGASASGCNESRPVLTFQFGDTSEARRRRASIGYGSGANGTAEMFVNLNITSVSATVLSASCAVALQLRANFVELTDRPFSKRFTALAVSDNDFPHTEDFKYNPTDGWGAFITNLVMTPLKVSQCRAGPPAVIFLATTRPVGYEEALLEVGEPVSLQADLLHVGSLSLYVSFSNSTGVNCRLTVAFDIEGLEVEMDATQAPPTKAPWTAAPYPKYTPTPTLPPTPYPPLRSIDDDHTLLIVLLSVFIGGPLIASAVVLAMCFCCYRRRTGAQQQDHQGEMGQGHQQAQPGML
eukprot:TRINITY_DN30383_c0_g1_i1.p1 TRINITY_DN30383_c0_g1~~TRINITY_DN30383_c0_g1_i1.p1  ORF type:complete len:350 (+),score=94.40 TRINITY_DN30383_c0_g1_i1:123-1172(+)